MPSYEDFFNLTQTPTRVAGSDYLSWGASSPVQGAAFANQQYGQSLANQTQEARLKAMEALLGGLQFGGSSKGGSAAGYSPQNATYTPVQSDYSPQAAAEVTPSANASQGYQALLEQLSGQISGLGGTRKAEIEESSRRSLAAAQSDVQGRGWGNSVLYGAANTAAERDKQVALGALNEQLLGQNINAQSNIGMASLSAQEREAEANRQASQYAQSFNQRNAETALQNEQMLRELNQSGSQYAQSFNQRNAETALQNQQRNSEMALQNEQFGRQLNQSNQQMLMSIFGQLLG